MSELVIKTAPSESRVATSELQHEISESGTFVRQQNRRQVVNNDYFKLTNYWETVWSPFHKPGAPDLYPSALRAEINTLNETLFHEVNNAVYKAGFAQSQSEYEKAYDLLFARLDLLEERLSRQRYLFGDQITDSDIRLYVTLARFDIAYHTVFKVNRNRLIDFPNLWNYAKDLYQTPGFGDTTDFDAIKRGYQLGSHGRNPYSILALGPDLSIWNERHDRARFAHAGERADGRAGGRIQEERHGV
jgi:putative glutathione S-transferase